MEFPTAESIRDALDKAGKYLWEPYIIYPRHVQPDEMWRGVEVHRRDHIAAYVRPLMDGSPESRNKIHRMRDLFRRNDKYQPHRFNLRRSRAVEIGSRIVSLNAAAEEKGLDPSLVYHRVAKLGWRPEDALRTPSRGREPTMITYQGRTQPLRAWCRELNLSRAAVYKRLKKGMSVEAAFRR